MGNANGRDLGGEGNGGDDGFNGDGDDSRMMRSPNRDSTADESMTIASNNEKDRGFGTRFSNSRTIPPNPPTSARTTSPLSFGPQNPVTPLEMFNGPLFPSQMWQSDSHGSVEPSEQRVPTIITWNYGGDIVAVEGSWDSWTSRKQMQRSGMDHSILMVLQSGIYHYKFIVDGEARYASDLPYLVDDKGQICNVLDVNEYVPENPRSVAEFESPASPEASYGQAFPSEEDFAKDPLGAPPQLHVTVLDLENPDGELCCASSGTKPQHVMLNHLYIERGWASQSLVALGMTHRFKSKYVTVVLYKALKR